MGGILGHLKCEWVKKEKKKIIYKNLICLNPSLQNMWNDQNYAKSS